MLVATIIAIVYVALIAMHTLAIHGDEPSDGRYRPRLSRWLTAGEARRLGRAESAAARRLLAGSLDRTSYRAAMAATAAQDAVANPIKIPKTRM